MSDTTPHLGLPLPSQDNTLDEDLLRLRAAFQALDAKLYALDNLLSSDDATLDQVQEIVNAIKENRAGVLDLISGKASKAELNAAVATLNSSLSGKADKSELTAAISGVTGNAGATTERLVGLSYFMGQS